MGCDMVSDHIGPDILSDGCEETGDPGFSIMLLDGEAKLVDFGLAKMSEHSTMGTSVQGMRRVVRGV